METDRSRLGPALPPNRAAIACLGAHARLGPLDLGRLPRNVRRNCRQDSFVDI